MSTDSTNTPRVFRVAVHLLVIVGLFTLPFASVGVLVVLRNGDYSVLSLSIGIATLLLILLQVLQLEIGPSGFKYRNLSGSRHVEFANVARAYFEVLQTAKAPQGVAAFWVGQRDGQRIKINLRTFPIEAAAVLFTALEKHGILIEIPEVWAARRMAERVRAAQSRLQQ